MTQKELAKLSEVSHRSVVTIEAGGKISLDTLKKIGSLKNFQALTDRRTTDGLQNHNNFQTSKKY